MGAVVHNWPDLGFIEDEDLGRGEVFFSSRDETKLPGSCLGHVGDVGVPGEVGRDGEA